MRHGGRKPLEEAGFVSVRVPAHLVKRIEGLVQESEAGFTTRNAFVTEAVRRFVELQEEEWMRRKAFLDWLRRQTDPARQPVPFDRRWRKPEPPQE